MAGTNWQFCRMGPVFLVIGCLLLLYFFVMDVLVYQSLQTTTFLDQSRKGGYSPFHPLSAKLLMMDHMDHYVYNPLAELVYRVLAPTGIFYVITPNFISISGLILGFVSAKFVTMESLYHRRIGVLIFEYRMWLDVLDGVVFRHMSGMSMYKSHRTTVGFFIDSDCDILSGVALAFGCLFYLWKYPPTSSSRDFNLPVTKPVQNENGVQNFKHHGTMATKNVIFFKVLIFGIVIVVAAATWDNTLQAYGDVLQKPMATSLQTEKQTEALHTVNTWLGMWSWRWCGSQALLHMIQIAIFCDRIWEFFNFIQYAGFIALAALNMYSYTQIKYLKASLGLEET